VDQVEITACAKIIIKSQVYKIPSIKGVLFTGRPIYEEEGRRFIKK